MITCIICGEACYDDDGRPEKPVWVFECVDGAILPKNTSAKGAKMGQCHVDCLDSLSKWAAS